MKATLLNASENNSDRVHEVALFVSEQLKSRNIDADLINLKIINILPCRSCDGCAYINPGKCISKDQTKKVIKPLSKSEMIIAFTDIRFGGYAHELKKVVDKMALLVTPFYKVSNGSLLHPSRYGKQKFFIVVGQAKGKISTEAKDTFKLLVKKNAVNLSIPHYLDIVFDDHSNDHQILDEIVAFLERSGLLGQ